MTEPETLRARGCLMAVGVSVVAWALVALVVWALVAVDTAEEKRADVVRQLTEYEQQPTPTITVTVTATPRPTRASRSSQRVDVPERTGTYIPPRFGNSVETPRFLCVKPKPRGPGQRYAVGFVKSCRQWVCLRTLWDRESGWRPTALGARTSHGRAYGIAQSMGMKPGTPMETQVRLGLKYVAHRYGTPCAALAAHNRKGWY